jgi:hypothetical protein
VTSIALSPKQYNLVNTWERRMEQEWEGLSYLWVDRAAVGPGKDFRKPTCDTLKWLTISLETIYISQFFTIQKKPHKLCKHQDKQIFIFFTTGLLMLCKKALITPHFVFCKSKSLLSLKIEKGYQSPAASKFKVFKNWWRDSPSSGAGSSHLLQGQ